MCPASSSKCFRAVVVAGLRAYAEQTAALTRRDDTCKMPTSSSRSGSGIFLLWSRIRNAAMKPDKILQAGAVGSTTHVAVSMELELQCQGARPGGAAVWLASCLISGPARSARSQDGRMEIRSSWAGIGIRSVSMAKILGFLGFLGLRPVKNLKWLRMAREQVHTHKALHVPSSESPLKSLPLALTTQGLFQSGRWQIRVQLITPSARSNATQQSS